MSLQCFPKFSFCVCWLLGCSLVIGQDAAKWTNPDGKEIAGEFVRMDAKTVTLRLASGKETKVPLTSLSLESHLQALKLAKPENFNKELVKAPEIVEPIKLQFKSSANSLLTSPFDDDPSIDSFMQTFTKEINRGNLFVAWHMMPPRMQSDMSGVISKGIVAAGPSAPNQLRKALSTAASIASKKRDWILDPAITGAQIPEEQLNEIKNAWPSIVAFFTEVSEKSLWERNNFLPENIPNFLASLLINFQYFEALKTSASPQLSYNIISQSSDRAEVELSMGTQKLPAVQFQKVGKIWVVPDLMNNIRGFLDKAAQVPMGPEVAAGFSQVMFIANPLLSKLDEAKTKDEFKKTIESVSNLLPKLPAGMAPGGLPGIPGIPGLGGN